MEIILKKYYQCWIAKCFGYNNLKSFLGKFVLQFYFNSNIYWIIISIYLVILGLIIFYLCYVISIALIYLMELFSSNIFKEKVSFTKTKNIYDIGIIEILLIFLGDIFEIKNFYLLL